MNRLLLFTAIVSLLFPSVGMSQQYYAVLITGWRPNICPGWPQDPNCQELEKNADDSYWNDTFMMWRTLVDNGWDPAKIYVLYYDGSNYLSRNPRYQGQITFNAATVGNVQNIFSYLTSSMTNNDVLFIWTYDHGEKDQSHNNSSAIELYLNYTSREQLWDTTFANWVNAIPCKKRIFVMEQCNSGGFIDNLQGPEAPPTVVLTSTTWEQYSYRADDSQPDADDAGENEYEIGRKWYHSEFNYHVLNAFRFPWTIQGNDIPDADPDYNGGVSMHEVYTWEYDHDSQRDGSTPQYSDPTGIGLSTYINRYMDLAVNNQSTTAGAIGVNSQRKLCRESSGTLHQVFESGGEVFYHNSTNGGSSWNLIVRLSDGTGASSAPCITMSNGVLLVAWQSNAPGEYFIPYRRSTDHGSTWTTSASLGSNISCASPGPLPALSGASSNGAFLAYRSNSGLVCKKSTDAGLSWSNDMIAPETGANSYNPSTAIYRYSTWHVISVGQLAYASELSSGNPSILYNFYNFDAGSFGTAVNVSSIVPGNNLGHANPSVAVSSDDGWLTTHVAWDALDPSNPGAGRVILYRKRPNSTGQFENQYTLIRYQGLIRPSITGQTQDNAYMVYQSENGLGVMWKDHYFLYGSSWGWGYPTALGQGTNPQVSVGSSSAKYIWTTGSNAPYQINLSSETLSKPSDDFASRYLRSLNFMDTASNASLSVVVSPVRLRRADNLTKDLDFAVSPADTDQINTSNIVNWGASGLLAGILPSDTLEFSYGIFGMNADRILSTDSGSVALCIVKSGTANVLARMIQASTATIPSSGRYTRVLQPVSALPTSVLTSGSIQLRPIITGLQRTPTSVASLGNIFECSANEQLGKALAEFSERRSAPDAYALLPNYPNPFNPSTTITFALPEPGNVSLVIYDVLGREVATLARSFFEAGTHSRQWNASDAASGVYYARITVTSDLGQVKFTKVAKVLLLK